MPEVHRFMDGEAGWIGCVSRDIWGFGVCDGGEVKWESEGI